jgi:DNA-binding response OmpR family regulator
LRHRGEFVKETTPKPSQSSVKEDGRILVLEPDAQLASAITNALKEASPGAHVDLTRSLEEAQRLVVGIRPDLFVLDVDASYDLGQEFLYDLRTSHPDARAIIITAIHLAAHREQAAGLGAIHFLEKPFPHGDFVDLVQALLRPAGATTDEKFQGTLSDLHIADIIQLKCMSGATSVLEFTGPRGEKARVFFEEGQVRHATAPGKEGMAAFNEIVSWKGGKISEVLRMGPSPRTINLDWQVLLMEAVRNFDEAGAARLAKVSRPRTSSKRKVLVIDDSLMLLSFVDEMLRDANYQVATAATGEEGLRAVKTERPDLILLDFALPDMKGDAVSGKLLEDPATAKIPIVYVSGFAGEFLPDRSATPNVIGSLNKPFTSDLLIKTVETHMPKSSDEPEPTQPEMPLHDESQNAPPQPEPLFQESVPETKQPDETSWWTEPGTSVSEPATADTMADANFQTDSFTTMTSSAPAPEVYENLPDDSVTGGAYFCGDTGFFSLNWALQTIAKEKLTGTLRSFWHKDPVDLLTKNGEIVLATTRDAGLYCAEAPITLVNLDAERIAAARAQQLESGCPLFLTLTQEGLILQEPAAQLVEHYGQRLFSQLWPAPRVRFVFHQGDLPSYANGIPSEPDIDNWALATLRCIQYHELGQRASYEPASIPAYTRDGFDRVQDLRLTVAEAQFASQFNGVRSIQQIAKNLRLDLKFARLTLFRFLALEIVECWPPSTAPKPERKGVFQRLARSIGVGE